MLDARSEKHGERYFSFLSNSAKSLLSLEPESVGSCRHIAQALDSTAVQKMPA